MDNKQKQIKYNQQKYYINKYKKNKAVNDIILKRKNDTIVKISDINAIKYIKFKLLIDISNIYVITEIILIAIKTIYHSLR